MLLTASQFFHDNQANYDGDSETLPVSATQHRRSRYGGAQLALTAVSRRHNATIGVYGFGQLDDESVRLAGENRTAVQESPTTGHLEALYLEDQYEAFSWLTPAFA